MFSTIYFEFFTTKFYNDEFLAPLHFARLLNVKL